MNNIANTEKEHLYSVFFGGNRSFYKQDYPILSFTPYTKEEDLFASIFPEVNRDLCPCQQTKKSEPLNPINATANPGSDDEHNPHKKISMELVCPHKDRKHYAKVSYSSEHVYQLLPPIRPRQEGMVVPPQGQVSLRARRVPKLLLKSLP